MITKNDYIEFLIATQINYTCSYMAEYKEGVSHDTISRFLKNEKLTPAMLWEKTSNHITESECGILIVDDSVQDKNYSKFIEMAKLQYSGNAGGLITGINIVNLVYSSGVKGDYMPIDFRVYDIENDGKTKNQHFQEMIINAAANKRLKAKIVVFDGWYGSWRNLKLLNRLDMVFYCPISKNRLVSVNMEEGYVHLEDIEWTEERQKNGVSVKLKNIPFKLRLFRFVAKNGNTEWIITNNPDIKLSSCVVQKANNIRWDIEEMHRELKQLTGIEKCQARSARAQRNHIACCYLAWLSMKLAGKKIGKTIYQVKYRLLDSYMNSQLANPTIPAYG